MAVTSVRLFTSVLRKPDAWIGLWGMLRGTPSNKLCASWNQYLHFSSAKLNASNYKTLFHNIFSLRLPGLFISPEYIFPFSMRLKSNISSKKSTKTTLQKVEDDVDSDEESDRNATREQEEEFEDDPSVAKDYKDLEKVVQSFRYDIILKTGLDIGRKYSQEHVAFTFLAPQMEILWGVTVRINTNARPPHLSHSIPKTRPVLKVKVGDTLDILIGEDKEAETETVMRILLKKVFEEKTESEKHRVVLRRWKHLKLPKKSVSK
ncbi:hypothetical protein TREES_T100016237 [Tupaia chinensis]|uniref:Mitochondrial transcription rescue factor 1 C-terminal domain-containing protein n=1 Tax=Tupaia chinensis TaxID=246437 RepID=L9JHS2_TUPCH|nr:hypothetical protein TREES_T100016237 [Tupaia chinensis]